MLSRDEVLKIADLTKIELSENEIEKFRKDLSAILDFVGEISKATGGKFEAGEQIMGLKNIFSEDKEHGLVEEKGRELIDQAPQTRDNFVVVPEVFSDKEK